MKSIKRLAISVGFVAASLFACDASAVLLQYSFTGTTSAATDSFLDNGSGLVNIGKGAAFTITGITTSDVDQNLSAGVGQFTATSTYDFGAFGSFVTNMGGDYLTQNCAAAGQIACVGLAALGLASGFVAVFSAIAGDSNVATAVVSPTVGGTSVIAGTRVLTNLAGDELNVNFGPDSIASFSVTALPEPTTAILLGLGLLGTTCMRRQREALLNTRAARTR